MFADEILVPSPDESKGNRRKSQANVQVHIANFIHSYLSVYLWLQCGVNSPHDTTKKDTEQSLNRPASLEFLLPINSFACIAEEKRCRSWQSDGVGFRSVLFAVRSFWAFSPRLPLFILFILGAFFWTSKQQPLHYFIPRSPSYLKRYWWKCPLPYPYVPLVESVFYFNNFAASL